LVKLGFHLTIGPRLRDRREDRGPVFGNAGCERSDEASLGFIYPRFELNLGLHSDHSSGIRQHWDALFDGGDRDGLRDLKGVADFANGRECAKNFGNALGSNLTAAAPM
jgi:hypothetical protein